jgi:DNA-binding transcriptional regulator YhcF (GntR family)
VSPWRTFAEQLFLSVRTVAKALQHMVKLGMVRETTGKQDHRVFTYHRYLEILYRGTELPK